MRKGTQRPLLALTPPLLANTAAHPATAWDESIDGELSDDRLNPSPVAFVDGANTVTGVVGPSSVDIDDFRFVVPADRWLSGLIVNPETYVVGAVSFFAIQVGGQVTVTPTGGGDGPAALLAFDHFGAEDVGKNLLARRLRSQPGLFPGTYSIWLNESSGPAHHSFDFVLTAVPEPASALLLAVGFAAFAAHIRSRRC